MKEVKNDVIKKFEYGEYVIYIKDTSNDYYEAYIQNEKYGIISLMIGVYKKGSSLEDFINWLENDLDNYICEYKENYED